MRQCALTLIGLALSVSGCGPEPYDVSENLSYDPTLGIYGSFDFY